MLLFAIRSASSISRVPKPYQSLGLQVILTWKNRTWCWNFVGSRPCTGQRSVNVQLPHDTTSTLVPFFPDKFRPECSFLRTHPETKESYEDISFWVFIREMFPAAIGCVVSPKQLNWLWANFVVDLVNLSCKSWDIISSKGERFIYPNFTESHISTFSTEVFHAV